MGGDLELAFIGSFSSGRNQSTDVVMVGFLVQRLILCCWRKETALVLGLPMKRKLIS